MKKIIPVVLLCFVLCACGKPFTFNKDELTLIESGDSLQAMRVLQTTNHNDSLFLRQPSIDINIAEEREHLQYLISRMRVTMDQEGGVGIAAVQVGVGRNVFLLTRLDKPNAPVEAIINPRIVASATDTVEFIGDGCLSIPDCWGITLRHPWVQVSYHTLDGTLVEEKIEGAMRPNGFTSVIFQHEYDHLQGVLFIDRISGDKLYRDER